MRDAVGHPDGSTQTMDYGLIGDEMSIMRTQVSTAGENALNQ